MIIRKYNKKITKIIAINLFIIAILLSMMIYPLKPEINQKEREIKLKWLAIYKNYTLYIDDNEEFTSPIVIKTERKDYPIELQPGVYFWKIKSGKISSPVKRLEIDSTVSIKVMNDSLENDGNADLNVSLGYVTGAVIAELPYKGKVKVEDNCNITAKEK